MFKTEFDLITEVSNMSVDRLSVLRKLDQEMENVDSATCDAALLRSAAAMVHAKNHVENLVENISAMEEALRGRLAKFGIKDSELGIRRTPRPLPQNLLSHVRAHLSAGLI
ncbi:hypothetical protein EJP67_28465 [Variovorax guangxiensis]|uniref:Uncharacterized protein n=1 Tax=Variovorax guangxiensis TaxID=1775474 RepID=A0A3S0XW11_9BURK|nr:hypothetical protein [Variovorax guangxiensis]RUR70994.1 hypothetical protein EJP67_28465 [Variovorax guangxiensis]